MDALRERWALFWCILVCAEEGIAVGREDITQLGLSVVLEVGRNVFPVDVVVGIDFKDAAKGTLAHERVSVCKALRAAHERREEALRRGIRPCPDDGLGAASTRSTREDWRLVLWWDAPLS